MTNVTEVLDAIELCLQRNKITNCIVLMYDGLIADFCKKNNIQYLIRGLRNTSDYLYEENIAKFNYELNPNLKTVYFRSINETISSSMVKELLKYKKPIDKYVPIEISQTLCQEDKI
jgi:pantetheine-phosphate adenylyltransferase